MAGIMETQRTVTGNFRQGSGENRTLAIARAGFGASGGGSRGRKYENVTFKLPGVGKVTVGLVKEKDDMTKSKYFYNGKKMSYDDLIWTIYKENGYSREESYELMGRRD